MSWPRSRLGAPPARAGARARLAPRSGFAAALVSVAVSTAVRGRGADGVGLFLRDGAIGHRLRDLSVDLRRVRCEAIAKLFRLVGRELARALLDMLARLRLPRVDHLLERSRRHREAGLCAVRIVCERG